jgi:hypothetical protein
LNDTIAAVHRALQRRGVVWAVGGSVLLRERGLDVATPNDLDILVPFPEAEASHEALRELGEWERGEPKAPFCTRHFYRYRIGAHDVEVLAGFRVEHAAGMFELPFSDDAIAIGTGPEMLPFSLLEDWWLLYSLMPSAAKRAKAEKIKRHLVETGSIRTDRLAALMNGGLPADIAEQIRALISCSK